MSGPVLLFVDDDPRILAGLSRLVRARKRGWTLLFAESGCQALEMLATRPVDLLVTDLRMPGLSGGDLLERVARDHPATLRFVLSGQADRDAILRLSVFSHQFLQKPCPPDRLLKALEPCFRYGALLDPAMRARLHSLSGLPSLADTGGLLAEQGCQRHSPSPQAVARHDIALAASLLRLANSAYFGIGARSYDPGLALTMLGQDTVAALMDAQALVRVPDAGPSGAYQTRCHAMGRHASALVADLPCRCGSPEALQLAGLLAPLGMLALNHLAESGPMPPAPADPLIVSAYLCDIWGIPDPVGDILLGAAGADAAPAEIDRAARHLAAAMHIARLNTFATRH